MKLLPLKAHLLMALPQKVLLLKALPQKAPLQLRVRFCKKFKLLCITKKKKCFLIKGAPPAEGVSPAEGAPPAEGNVLKISFA